MKSLSKYIVESVTTKQLKTWKCNFNEFLNLQCHGDVNDSVNKIELEDIIGDKSFVKGERTAYSDEYITLDELKKLYNDNSKVSVKIFQYMNSTSLEAAVYLKRECLFSCLLNPFAKKFLGV